MEKGHVSPKSLAALLFCSMLKVCWVVWLSWMLILVSIVIGAQMLSLKNVLEYLSNSLR